MKKLYPKFASDLSALLAERGMTQKELAITSGLTEACISNYLHGKRFPHVKAIDAINEALGTTLNRGDYIYVNPEEVKKKSSQYYYGICYQKLMRDGRFDILEKILEIEKQIASLEEEKKTLLESA